MYGPYTALQCHAEYARYSMVIESKNSNKKLPLQDNGISGIVQFHVANDEHMHNIHVKYIEDVHEDNLVICAKLVAHGCALL